MILLIVFFARDGEAHLLGLDHTPRTPGGEVAAQGVCHLMGGPFLQGEA